MKVKRRQRTAPLWWMDPPSTVVAGICAAARAEVRWFGGGKCDVLNMQPWLRKVSEVSGRMLREAHIYVEGA
jgi:hypothetical protein